MESSCWPAQKNSKLFPKKLITFKTLSHKNTYKLLIGPDFGILPLEIFFKWTEKWTEKFIFKFVNWTKFFFKRVNFELNLVHFLARWTRTELSSHFWWTVTSLSINFKDIQVLTNWCYLWNYFDGENTAKKNLKNQIMAGK